MMKAWTDKVPPWVVQTLWAGLLGAGIGAALILMAMVGYGVAYHGHIFPGVRVAGVDVGGLTPAEAAARLDAALTFPTTGKITLTYGEQRWEAAPLNLGFALDNRAAAEAAYRIGRRGGLVQRLRERWTAYQRGWNLPPVGLFSEAWAWEYLDGLAAAVDRPPQEAVLRLEGTQIIAQPGQVGKTLDRTATIARLREALPRLQNATIPLVVTEQPPSIINADDGAALLRQILAAPFKVTLPHAADGDPDPWTFSPQTLAAMLRIQPIHNPQGGYFQVDLDAQPLQGFLERLAPQLQREAANARFAFDEETHRLRLLQHAVEGRALDVEASLAALKQAILEGKHEAPLVVSFHPPAVGDDATAAELGITELVAKHTTFFYGSSAPRIHNIQTAAARFQGYLVAPGETFSMARVLGDVSLDNGYAEALIIYGDRTIKGVGGGVCQVSTTLFRTVFFGGYPVVERHAHAYRVLYYEQRPNGTDDPNLAGLDATVYAPLVDFKFKNDTPHWILMVVDVQPQYRYITWKFYSTSDGRTVEWYTTGLQNIVPPPPPQYIENPDLAKGEIKQVDWAVEGADVTVTRKVWRKGELLFEDTFKTHYLPWRAVCEYGPGTPGMPPEHPDPDDPCKPDPPKEDDGE